ncbi:MAG TPA: beta-L-arabinofuranosidase domain-containing protein, partial [Chitinophagaceae bacterium]|nr:beta-L-arabinofuranosidase domain-containing protein [Chitinophagaceae bacterium]
KKKDLLNIALKNADLVCSVFGSDKKHVAPGHEIVEMGLVRLYRITGKKEYLNTAAFFIKERGHFAGYDATNTNPWKNGSYWQDDRPVVDQNEAEGHAVRAGYLYSAVADVAALTGDDSLLHAIDKIWNNVVDKKMYVQGSVGAKGDGERFGENYELPNATAYNETCAAIANVYWNQRMFLLHGDSKYIDVLEKTLYNGLISGIGLDGKSFFYTNAMQIRNDFKFVKGNDSPEVSRSGWFTCSCCPTNLVRLIPSIPGYMYAQRGNNIYVNLFANSTAQLSVGKNPVQIIQQNTYPWDGALLFTINPKVAANFNMLIRIPGWATNEAIPSTLYKFEDDLNKKVIVKVNGIEVKHLMQNGYCIIKRKWKNGDKISVDLPMNVRKVVSNKNLTENIDKVALQRGPLIYCGEWVDNNGSTSNIIFPNDIQFRTEFSNLFNGIMVLKSEVNKLNSSNNTVMIKQPFIAVPYYAWANRGRGEMQI